MAKGYVWEKLFSAVSGLAESDASLVTRLDSALMGIHLLREDDVMSNSVRERVLKLQQIGGDVEPDGVHGTVAIALGRMGELELQGIAEEIVSPFDDVTYQAGVEDGRRGE